MSRPTLLVVLQCAYGNTSRRRKQLLKRRIWLAGLWRSHTGRRLKQMIPKGFAVVPINATASIGIHANSVFPPDPLYVGKAWEIINPDVTLACGQIARQAVEELGIDHLGAPHPAWRQLTTKAIDDVHRQLEEIL